MLIFPSLFRSCSAKKATASSESPFGDKAWRVAPNMLNEKHFPPVAVAYLLAGNSSNISEEFFEKQFHLFIFNKSTFCKLSRWENFLCSKLNILQLRDLTISVVLLPCLIKLVSTEIFHPFPTFVDQPQHSMLGAGACHLIEVLVPKKTNLRRSRIFSKINCTKKVWLGSQSNTCHWKRPNLRDIIKMPSRRFSSVNQSEFQGYVLFNFSGRNTRKAVFSFSIDIFHPEA